MENRSLEIVIFMTEIIIVIGVVNVQIVTVIIKTHLKGNIVQKETNQKGIGCLRQGMIENAEFENSENEIFFARPSSLCTSVSLILYRDKELLFFPGDLILMRSSH